MAYVLLNGLRRIKFAMASGFPGHNEFALAYVYLERAFPR